MSAVAWDAPLSSTTSPSPCGVREQPQDGDERTRLDRDGVQHGRWVGTGLVRIRWPEPLPEPRLVVRRGWAGLP